jgi:hypothetical protein
MMAMSKSSLQHQEPDDIEALLPWHAAGTLSARDARHVGEALDRDPALARQYAAILEEYAATIGLNESLGAPSSRAMQKLFTAIDAEPAQPRARRPGMGARLTGFFANLSPKALAWCASVAAIALVLQAVLIGAMLAIAPNGVFQTAAYQPERTPPPSFRDADATQRTADAPKPAATMVMAERSGTPLVRSLMPDSAPRVLVRFAPEARASDIAALLDQYQAAVVDSSKGGLFRLQFPVMSKQDQDRLMGRLAAESIVALALPAP